MQQNKEILISIIILFALQVWRNLARYLSLAELKCLRLTCKAFNAHVLTSTHFNSRSLVNILQDRANRLEFGETRTFWKNLKIPYENDNTTEYKKNESLSWFYPLLMSVEELTIIVKRYNPGRICSKTYPVLEKILDAPNSLKKWTMSFAMLKAPETPSALENLSERAVSNLNNLTGLHLMSCCTKSKFYPPGVEICESSTRLLLPLLKNLSNIKIETIDTTVPKKIGSFLLDHRLYQNLIKIILNNSQKIVNLDIGDHNMWHKPNNANLLSLLDSDVIFPRLESLRIVASKCQNALIMDFLQRQPNLIELDVTMHDQFSNDLMNIIRRKSKMLKRLRIKTKGFDKKDKERWTFLSGLEQLKDFTLEFVNSIRIKENCGMYLLKNVLANMPPSIKKIFVRSYSQQSDGYLIPSDFARIREENLTDFTVQVGDTIRDSTLEYIFKNLKSLEHLDIARSMEKCTDYGFTGKDEELDEQDSHFSINNLKGKIL